MYVALSEYELNLLIAACDHVEKDFGDQLMQQDFNKLSQFLRDEVKKCNRPITNTEQRGKSRPR